MFKTPEQFAAANKATVDSLLSLANTALASAERIAALNLNTARSVMEDSVSGAKAMMGAKDVQEALSIQASLAQPNVEKAVAYSRSVYEISAQTQEELSKMVEGQFGDFQKTVAGLLDKAAKSAPAGSDVAVAAVKSAIAAANSAFDNMNKAAKQVAEITEANVAAATNATVKAVGAAAKGKKVICLKNPRFGGGSFHPHHPHKLEMMMSNPNIEQLTAAQKANAEVMMTLLRTAFNGVERLTALNMAASREFFNNTVANAQQLLSAKDASAVAKLNTELAQPNVDKLVGYSRSVYDLVTEMQKEITSVMEAQYSSFTKNAAAAVEKAKASAPVGGDVFAATMQSMLGASTKAFDNMTSMAKQLSDIAEANMQAASKTTKAAAPAKSATAAAAKKAAK
jgi:phasin family protein